MAARVGATICACLGMWSQASPASAATFQADAATLGPIPDGFVDPFTCDAPLGSRDVRFAVAGQPPGPPNGVAVTLDFDPVHGWVGDISATLIAPNGVSHALFARTGATLGDECGDSSNLAGPYVFSDAGPGGWPQAAAAVGGADAIAAGSYRTDGLLAAFAGLNDVNGVWTLRVRDHRLDETGGVGSATLDLTVDPYRPGVDETAPETVIDRSPKAKSKRRRATFHFSASEPGSSFECALDREFLRPCASPRKVRRLKPGRHRFRVRATDLAGNTDPTPALAKFKVKRRR